MMIKISIRIFVLFLNLFTCIENYYKKNCFDEGKLCVHGIENFYIF